MNLRVVLGLVGLWLAGFAEACPAQTIPDRDPSFQVPVGLGPIPSIGESINNTTVISSTVPLAPSAVPSSPIGQGKALDATLPRAPVLPSPVSITPIETISWSINRGFRIGSYSGLFHKPTEGPNAVVLRSPPRVEPAPKADAWSVPSILASTPSTEPSTGRPAPFAGRSPDSPRPQSDPAVSTAAQRTGRPAPFAEDRPRSARPQAPIANAPVYRPAVIPSAPPEPVVVPVSPEPPSTTPVPESTPPVLPEPTVPAPVAPEPPTQTPTPPVELPPAPGIEAGATPSALGSDPLGGLEPVPSPVQAPALPAVEAPAAVESAPMPSLAPAPGPGLEPGAVDPDLNRTNLDQTAVRTAPVRARQFAFEIRRAAAVGDEIITMNELETAVNAQLKQSQQMPMTQAEERAYKNQVAAVTLNHMIDQALVVQEAKRKLKANPKMKELFDEIVDKEWKTQELPPMLRNTASSNVHELKVKLAAEGVSYESLKEVYRKNMMFHQFLMNEIRGKVTADMSEMRIFYAENLDKFEQPARMTWREIEINFDKYPNRAAARQKAEEVLARLLHDEDFNAIARSISNGPTASKGGVYVDMQPGSYGIPVVNDELNRIPIGQVSQILEAPGSFHIIRVDSRREKGPLRFDEVQDQIRQMVMQQNHLKAREEDLAKLRTKTLIKTIFDNTASDPELARRHDAAVRQASLSR